MALPPREYFTLHEAAARWDCTLADIAGWASAGRFDIVTAIAPVMQILKDVAGFVVVAVTEGIARPDEIESVEAVETDLGIDLQIWLKGEAGERLAQRRRTMAGPVGCGLCGIDSLSEAVRRAQPIRPTDFALHASQVRSAIASLPQHQPLHDATRAAHAAAFWTPVRGIVALREDVGRHNALDKLAGGLVRGTVDRGQGALIITSRVSIDMVQKAAAIGSPILIAVSAPTATAVEQANAAGITLIALARADHFEVFSRPDRIFPDEATDVA